MRYMPSREQIRRMNTDELRQAFLVTDLFRAGEVVLEAIDLDRVVLGGAVPIDAPLELEAPEFFAATHFTERRELGVLNIGGPGRVRAEGETYALGKKDALYLGRGTRDIIFESDDAAQPARFYLVSYPAHANHPATIVSHAKSGALELGSEANANRRRLAKYFHPDANPTAQLVMGVTELQSGSVWNTMPPHTHQRRTEVYLYFDIPDGAVVFHFLGEPAETRSLVVRNEQVALSPGWSIHAGCGTASYSFCWAMGGENQAFTDMQGVDMNALR